MTIAQIHADALKLADERQPEVVRRVLNWLLRAQQPPDVSEMDAYVALVIDIEHRAKKIRGIQSQMECESEDEDVPDYATLRKQVIEQQRERDALVVKSVVMYNQMWDRGISTEALNRLYDGAMEEAKKPKSISSRYIGYDPGSPQFCQTTCTTATTYNFHPIRYGA